MMRVLFVAGRFPPDVTTGFSLAFDRLVQQARRTLAVRVVAGVRGARSQLPHDVLAVRVPDHRIGRWLALWRAARTVAASQQPDVVVTAGLGLPPMGIPTVAVLPDGSQRGWKEERPRRLARAAARIPRAVVVPTVAMRAQASALGIAERRVHLVPIGRDRPEAPPALAAPRTPLRVLHPGTIHPAKGQHVTIDAVCRLPPEIRRQVRLTVAGPVADARYLAQLRVAVRGQPIELVPDPEDAAERLARCHVVALPVAAQAGFPDQALAALGAARPVLWSDVGAMPEVLTGQGIRVPPHDVDAVRDALIGLVDHRGLAEVGVRGWQRAGESTWDRVWPKWERVLAGVLR